MHPPGRSAPPPTLSSSHSGWRLFRQPGMNNVPPHPTHPSTHLIAHTMHRIYYRFNIFRATANIFRSFFISSRLSKHVEEAPNNSGVSQSARLKHSIITAHCIFATGRSRRTVILHLSSQRCGPACVHGSAAASTVYKSQM